MPIREEQALEDADIWKSVAASAEDDRLPSLQSAGDDAYAGMETMRPQDRVLLKLIDGKAAAECESGEGFRMPLRTAADAVLDAVQGRRLGGANSGATAASALRTVTLGRLARVPRSASVGSWQHRPVTELVDTALDKARSKAEGMEKAWSSVPPGPSAPVQHEGEACWESCGNNSGNCSSGFCGGGVCCRRWRIHPECPLGLHGGCSDNHCCVERPPMASAPARGQPKCHADPGSYCLWSLAKGLQQNNLSSVEFCAFERTMYRCPPGFFCAGGEESPRACRRGRRCPVGSSLQLPCPAGSYCPISIWQEPCPTAHVCAENATQPELCPAGSYCSGGFDVPCPAGYVCAPGSTVPVPCALLATCPEGSASQGWDFLARCSLLVVVPLWTVAVRAVPRWLHPQGGLSGAIPTLTTLGVLGAAWAANLNIMYVMARQLSPSGGDPEQLQIERLFGFTSHATALVFVTICYSLLLYGFFVSFQVRDADVRFLMDSCMGVACCLSFAAYLEDWHALAFLASLWAAFRVIWMMLTQRGPLVLRAALLCGALAMLTLGFLWLAAPGLAKLLVFLSLAAAAREACQLAVPGRVLIARLQRPAGAREVAPLATFAAVELPVINGAQSCSAGDAQGEQDATAAAVILAARASLAAYKIQPEPYKCALPPHLLAEAVAPTAVPDYDSGRGDEGNDSNDDARGLCGRGAASAGGISFDLRGVSFRLDGGRRLLQDLSFSVPAGATVAIMGASGAGKTTLLSVLAGRCGDGRLLGELRLNGAQMLPWQLAALRPLMGYVPQDDVMHSCLTVRENIEFQAELRLRHAMGGESLERTSRDLRLRIEAVINGLGLAHVRDRCVRDGLSGGQRKRVSIGMEIVSRPQVLLLDEPSSGLDSSTSHRILEMVLEGARLEHCTTFGTIHQPRWSTLGLFDMLILLAPGGHLCYAGPVPAAKDYFMAVPHLEFPKDQNPADVIIDATTFESARMMAVDGIWRGPPQCLRAVLIPTPEMDDEESKEPWQMEEFGRMLAALWRGFAAVQPRVAGAATLEPPAPAVPEGAAGLREALARQPRLPLVGRRRTWASMASFESDLRPPGDPTFHDRLVAAAQKRAEEIHWAQQIWMHMARGLLVMSRALWPTIALNVVLLMVAMGALAWAFPDFGLRHVFLKTSLMLLLLCLTQSVAAQRIFGGEEQAVACREASVCSLSQVVFGFLGKDMASLVEIGLSAACFTLTYWPLVRTNASGGDIFAVGFACLYCVWGQTHIWAVAFPPHTAMLLAVIVSFMSFLFCGVKPAAHDLAAGMGGYGSLLLLASPIRFALGQLIYGHVTGRGSTYLQENVKRMVEGNFDGHGFKIELLPRRCPDRSAGGILQRWLGHNGWACHSGQLFLLGFLYRFLAVVCLLLMSSAQASGGQLSFGVPSAWKTRLLRALLTIFLVFFALFQLLLLGQTY